MHKCRNGFVHLNVSVLSTMWVEQHKKCWSKAHHSYRGHCSTLATKIATSHELINLFNGLLTYWGLSERKRGPDKMTNNSNLAGHQNRMHCRDFRAGNIIVWRILSHLDGYLVNWYSECKHLATISWMIGNAYSTWQCSKCLRLIICTDCTQSYIQLWEKV